jgi:hypothetical protein
MNRVTMEKNIDREYCGDYDEEENAGGPGSDSLPSRASRRLLDKAWPLGWLAMIRR